MLCCISPETSLPPEILIGIWEDFGKAWKMLCLFLQNFVIQVIARLFEERDPNDASLRLPVLSH